MSGQSFQRCWTESSKGMVSNSPSSSETRVCLKSNGRFGLDRSSLRVCFGQIDNEWPVAAARLWMCTVRLGLSRLLESRVSDSYLGVVGGRASAGHRTRAVGGELLVRRTKEDGEGSCPCA